MSSIKRCVQNNFADVHRQQVTRVMPAICSVCFHFQVMCLLRCGRHWSRASVTRADGVCDWRMVQVIERFHGYAPTIDEPPVLISPARSPAASASAPSPSAQGDAAEFPDTDAPAER